MRAMEKNFRPLSGKVNMVNKGGKINSEPICDEVNAGQTNRTTQLDQFTLISPYFLCEIRDHPMHTLGRKKHMLFGNAQALSDTRTVLKLRY